MNFDHNIKILVVDDMSATRKILTKMLLALKYENVESCVDGGVAWEMIQKAVEDGSPYDLIMSDWNMPNVTGLELLKMVRNDERFKELPFIMISSESESENIESAVQAGVSNYIVKPFTIESLKQMFLKVL